MGDRQVEHHRKLVEMVRPQVSAGEDLLGVLVVNDSGFFSQKLHVVGVTPSRLVFQPVSMRWSPKGEPFSVQPSDLAEVSGADMGAEVGGFDPGDIVTRGIMGSAGGTVKLRTHDGRKMKLMMMGGDGTVGEALATDGQQIGYAAFMTWLGTHAPR
jgi:hypothetical protein